MYKKTAKPPKQRTAEPNSAAFTVGRVLKFIENGLLFDEKTGKTPNQAFFWDTKTPGLGVKLAKSGRATYVVQYRIRGQRAGIRLTLGSVDSWPLESARQEAKRITVLMDKGEDPRQQIRENRQKARNKKFTVGDVWDTYTRHHKRRWSERHYQDMLWLSHAPQENREAGPLWPLLSKQANKITPQALLKWARELTISQERKAAQIAAQAAQRAKGKRTRAPQITTGLSNRGKNSALKKSFMYFRACWRWAYQRPGDFGPLIHPEMLFNQDLRALIPRVEPRSDTLEKSQLAPWFNAVTKISNPVISAYLQCLLLTGARRRELSKLQWKDVNFQWKALHLQDKIEASGRAVPLTPYCEFLIDRLPRESQWVFHSPSAKSGHIEEPRLAHNRALEIAGLPENLTLHGLRRSFSTLSEWCEMPVGVVAQIMGHRPSATAEKHYKRRPLELLAMHHNRLEAWILEQAKIDFTPEATTGPRLVTPALEAK
ncbi:MAG: integrase family protein [Proteobacteria bacterium]|nr:integrase family protein [Pseudomonadota bacterium]